MNNEIKLILEGVRKGDQIGGPYELSKILQSNNIYGVDLNQTAVELGQCRALKRYAPHASVRG